MESKHSTKKVASLVLLVLGVALIAVSLVFDFMGNGFSLRGAMLIVGIIAVLAGLYFFPSSGRHKDLINVIFLFPLLFTFCVTVIIPLILGIFYSMTNWTGIKYTEFVGLSNYAAMFKEVPFLWSLLLTILFVVFNMILVNVVAFVLALLCTSRIRGIGFFRAAYFLPNLIGGIVLGYVWQFVFNNVLIKVIGNGISLLSNTPTAFMAIIVVYIWQYAGYIMLIYINGLVTIPGEVIEAANIDGCSYEGIYFRIVFPLLKPSIVTVTILNGMWIWNDYLLPSLMLGQNGKVKTLPVAVQAFVGSYVKQWDLILTAALLAMVPMIVIFLIGQKQIMSGMVEGAVK